MGFQDVRTVLASGNVAFVAGAEEDTDAPAVGIEGDADALAARIEGELRRTFGYPIGVVVRPLADLERLVASAPFTGIAIGPETRLYVTFLSRPANNGTGICPETVDGNLQLVKVAAQEVLTAIRLSPNWGTTELMAYLEKQFGPGVTTRNWNTIVKVVAGRE
jgi:uncharacterized protein (DUF1697 family)